MATERDADSAFRICDATERTKSTPEQTVMSIVLPVVQDGVVGIEGYG